MNQPNENPDGPSQDSSKKAKILTEEAKDRQTTHWDIDYMTREQIDAAHRKGEDQTSSDS